MTILTSRKSVYALALVAFLFSRVSWAQDAQFSQFYASSLYLNPALAGLESDITFNSNFRTQWRSASKPYLTNQISAIIPIYSGLDRRVLTGGIGVSVFNDQAGDGSLSTNGLMLTGAYSLGFSNDLHRISLGAQLGFSQKSLDYNNLTWGQQADDYSNLGLSTNTSYVSLPGIVSKKVYYPVNAGFVWSYNPSRNYYRSGTSAFLGASITNINKPDQSLNVNETHAAPSLIRAHAGIEFHLSPKVNFSPSFLYAKQAELNQLNLGAYITYKMFDSPFGFLGQSDIILGGYYRLNDAGILSLGISNPSFTAGFSYDANTGDIRNYTTNFRGAYELSFAFRAIKDKRRKRFDTPRI